MQNSEVGFGRHPLGFDGRESCPVDEDVRRHLAARPIGRGRVDGSSGFAARIPGVLGLDLHGDLTGGDLLVGGGTLLLAWFTWRLARQTRTLAVETARD